ncbi:phage protein [Escherichia coli]|nr:phage protein [Escherichia coli]
MMTSSAWTVQWTAGNSPCALCQRDLQGAEEFPVNKITSSDEMTITAELANGQVYVLVVRLAARRSEP